MSRLLTRTALLFALTAFAAQAIDIAAADIVGEDMTLPAKERQVHVTLFRAPGDGPHPAALLLHGASGFNGRYDTYARTVAKAGIDAYLVYYYSDKDEQDLASGPNIFPERYAAWARLIDDVAEDVRGRGDCTGKVGLIGFSNGAILASGASMLAPDIAAAVIYYGTVPYHMEATRFPPLLILHGDADRVIPVTEGRHLAEVARGLGVSVDLVVYPGEGHGFGPTVVNPNAMDALNRTIAFLRKELEAK